MQQHIVKSMKNSFITREKRIIMDAYEEQ